MYSMSFVKHFFHSVNRYIKWQDRAVVSTSAWHASDPGRTPSHGRHGIFGIKSQVIDIGDCLSLVNWIITLISV